MLRSGGRLSDRYLAFQKVISVGKVLYSPSHHSECPVQSLQLDWMLLFAIPDGM